MISDKLYNKSDQFYTDQACNSCLNFLPYNNKQYIQTDKYFKMFTTKVRKCIAVCRVERVVMSLKEWNNRKVYN